MPRANPLISAFNAGEFSPRMAARVDFAKYPNACEQLENMIPLVQGGAMRRAGTRFVAEVKDSSKTTRLLEFEFSTEQAYVIECGAQYFRFYRDRGQIVAPAISGAAITNGSFDSGISGWTNRSTGSASISHDGANKRLSLVGAAASAAIAEQEVAVSTTGVQHVLRFTVARGPVGVRIGASSLGAELHALKVYHKGTHTVTFVPGGASAFVQFVNEEAATRSVDDVALLDDVPVELATPYAEADLFALKFAQSADTMYIAHRDYPLRKLTRAGHTSWSLIEVELVDGPYLPVNIDVAATLTPSGTNGTITISAAKDTFTATDIDRLVRIKHGSTWGRARIVSFATARSVGAEVVSAFGATTASDEWRQGAFSVTSGYPSALAFYEQRLYLAATRAEPQALFGSRSAALEDFTPGADDDDPVDYRFAADRVNAIRWMSPGSQLLIGTVGGEWIVRASSLDDPITPTNIQVKRQTTLGSADIAPVRVGHAVLFLQRAGRNLHEIAYSFDADGFRSPDMTILADHVGRGGFGDLAYQQKPDSILWCVRKDGQLCGFTYDREQDVLGWSRHITRGAFEAVASIPAADCDEVWCIAKRSVGGQDRRYIEVFETCDFPSQADAFFVDCGLSYDGGPTSTLAGLDHLEGMEVQVAADGAVHPARTVSGGAITLEAPASKVHAGLSYKSVMRSLRIEAGAAAGTAMGETKRIHGVTLVMLETLGLKVGPKPDRLLALPFRKVDQAMDAAVPLVSGERYVPFEGDYDTDTRIDVVQDQPMPATILALVPHLKTNPR